MEYSIEDIPVLLFEQGLKLRTIGLELLESSDGSIRKINSAASILESSARTFARAVDARTKGGTVDPTLVEARRLLIEEAYKRGYEIAFEVDGRITLECVGDGGVLVLDSQ